MIKKPLPNGEGFCYIEPIETNPEAIVRFQKYMNWLSDVSILLERPVKPSPLAVELFSIEATPEDAVLDYGDQL